MTLRRRDVLQLVGGATTAATIAGSAGTVTVTAQEEPDDLPTYSRWLTIDDGSLEFASVDWATVDEIVREELEEAEPDDEVPPAFEADPMVAPVSEGALSAYLFVGLSLGQFRLGRILDEDAFESTVDGLLQTPDAFVVTGNLLPGEIDEQLTADPEAGFIRQLEPTDEIGSYDVYTPVDGGDDAAIAVGDEALAAVTGADESTGDPLSTLETRVGAAEGDIDRAADESEAFEWALSSAGRGDVVVGQYGPETSGENGGLVDFTYPELEDAESIVSSLAIGDEETSTGDFAAVVDEPDEAALEELLGASGDDQSVTVDGNRVTATATWQEEAVTVNRQRGGATRG